MTEQDWLICEDPGQMFEAMTGIDKRKWMLIACACCLRHPELLNASRSSHIINEYRLLADTFITTETFKETCKSLLENDLYDRCYISAVATESSAMNAAICIAQGVATYVASRTEALLETRATSIERLVIGNKAAAIERRAQADIIRDIVGLLPFRNMRIKSGCITPTAIALAQTVYQEDAFELLPILADALLDGGCHQPDVINHLHSCGPHARGCWVVDLLLGKQ